MAQQRNKEENKFVGIKIAADRLETQTDKALAFRLGDSKKVDWIPKSQVKDWDRDDDTGIITFAVPVWIFKDKGLDDFHDENYVDLDEL